MRCPSEASMASIGSLELVAPACWSAETLDLWDD